MALDASTLEDLAKGLLALLIAAGGFLLKRVFSQLDDKVSRDELRAEMAKVQDAQSRDRQDREAVVQRVLDAVEASEARTSKQMDAVRDDLGQVRQRVDKMMSHLMERGRGD